MVALHVDYVDQTRRKLYDQTLVQYPLRQAHAPGIFYMEINKSFNFENIHDKIIHSEYSIEIPFLMELETNI